MGLRPPVWKVIGPGVASLLACVLAYGQSPHTAQVCDAATCSVIDTSTIGGIRFEDYQVTNPKAVQFDPEQRLNELAAIGPANAQTLCEPGDIVSYVEQPATISFTNVLARIREVSFPNGAGTTVQEFLDVEFSNFSTSGGYASPTFGLKMARNRGEPTYFVEIHPGNPGLQNIPGLTDTIGYQIDPVTQTANLFGTPPAAIPLKQAVFAVFLRAQSILSAAAFSTQPAESGLPLWTSSDIIALAGQAQSLIAATGNPAVAPPPLFTCTYPRPNDNAYAVCDSQHAMEAFGKAMLTWGGQYLGLRTEQSFQVLRSNLVTWAQADAPRIDPAFPDNGLPFEYAMMSMTKPILMLWPTLRDDARLSDEERQLVENWITNTLMPRAGKAGGTNGGQAFTNNWGYFGASVQMADAIRRRDHATFARAVQEFYVGLNQTRQDGSFPLEAERSACSAIYSDVAIHHLVTIAEMAATQGYDLYHLSANGKSLEGAIQFLLNARDNPALLSQYSQAGGGVCFEGNPGDPPDFSTVFNKSMPSDLAWAEAYLARFPRSETAARLRTVLGSDITVAPFPLFHVYAGLNMSCAFRKPDEFQPFHGAQVAIVRGDGQTAVPNQPSPEPLEVRVTNDSGVPLDGALVSFAVTGGSANLIAPSQVLTDAAGSASAKLTIGPGAGPVTVTATALGVSAGFSIAVPGLAIYNGGIGGIAGSVPPVATISPGALLSIYGQEFVPAGTGRRVTAAEIVRGALPTNLLGVCVTAGGLKAPMLDVYPGQINAVAPALSPGSIALLTVTTGCGGPNAAASLSQSVRVTLASPEFLYFTNKPDGLNPVAALNASTGAYVGPAELGAGFVPARPGDFITIFASGFGPTAPLISPGSIPDSAASISTPFTVTLGSVTLDAADVLYAGAAPGQIISQLNIHIPATIPAGNQPLRIRIGDFASPAGAFLRIETSPQAQRQPHRDP